MQSKSPGLRVSTATKPTYGYMCMIMCQFTGSRGQVGGFYSLLFSAFFFRGKVSCWICIHSFTFVKVRKKSVISVCEPPMCLLRFELWSPTLYLLRTILVLFAMMEILIYISIKTVHGSISLHTSPMLVLFQPFVSSQSSSC